MTMTIIVLARMEAWEQKKLEHREAKRAQHAGLHAGKPRERQGALTHCMCVIAFGVAEAQGDNLEGHILIFKEC